MVLVVRLLGLALLALVVVNVVLFFTDHELASLVTAFAALVVGVVCVIGSYRYR